MGLACDTVLGEVTNSTALIAATIANGDSLTVRAFNPPNKARMEQVIRKGATKGLVQVKSPMFHDDVQGIQLATSEVPTVQLMPRETGQPLVSTDTLVLSANSGGADSTIAALCHYYENLPGASARYASWGDISGNVKSIKPLHVAVTASATIGAWADFAVTTSENLLHAATDYAVLGYITEDAIGVVGVRGQETGNLRCSGPGTTSSLSTDDYFVMLSELYGAPHIPIFNQSNQFSYYVSVADNAVSTATTVTLILAEMATPLTNI